MCEGTGAREETTVGNGTVDRSSRNAHAFTTHSYLSISSVGDGSGGSETDRVVVIRSTDGPGSMERGERVFVRYPSRERFGSEPPSLSAERRSDARVAPTLQTRTRSGAVSPPEKASVRERRDERPPTESDQSQSPPRTSDAVLDIAVPLAAESCTIGETTPTA